MGRDDTQRLTWAGEVSKEPAPGSRRSGSGRVDILMGSSGLSDIFP
jgi:hypothetical protein